MTRCASGRRSRRTRNPIDIGLTGGVDDRQEFTGGRLLGLDGFAGGGADEPTPDGSPAMGNAHMDLLNRRRA